MTGHDIASWKPESVCQHQVNNNCSIDMTVHAHGLMDNVLKSYSFTLGYKIFINVQLEEDDGETVTGGEGRKQLTREGIGRD